MILIYHLLYLHFYIFISHQANDGLHSIQIEYERLTAGSTSIRTHWHPFASIVRVSIPVCQSAAYSVLYAPCLLQMAIHLPVLCQCTASSPPLTFPYLVSSLDSWYSISCIYCLQCKCLKYLLLGRVPLAFAALLTGRVVLWCVCVVLTCQSVVLEE